MPAADGTVPLHDVKAISVEPRLEWYHAIGVHG